LNHSNKVTSSYSESINEEDIETSIISSKIRTAEPINLENTNPIEQSECDTIILNNGQIIRVNIINTPSTLVRYTKCDSEDQTELILAKEEVKALQYANGDFEFIKHNNLQNKSRNESPLEKPYNLKKSGKVLLVTTLVLLSVLGMVIGVFAYLN
jgi:hypothetical protein